MFDTVLFSYSNINLKQNGQGADADGIWNRICSPLVSLVKDTGSSEPNSVTSLTVRSSSPFVGAAKAVSLACPFAEGLIRKA